MKKRLAMIIALALVATSVFAGLQGPFSYADGETVTVKATVEWIGLDDGENPPDIALELQKKNGDNDPEAVVFEEGSGEQNPKTLAYGESSVTWTIAPPAEGYEYLFRVVEVPEGFKADACVADAETEYAYKISLTKEDSQPKDYTENASSEAKTVLKSIENGSLDGATIETVKLDPIAIENNGFWTTLNDALGSYEDGQQRISENTILRVVVPNGEYDIENAGNNPVIVYSNTILDLRGTGSGELDGYLSPYDATDDKDSVHLYSNSHNGNVIRAGKNNEESKGWDYYKNITILGGTIHGKTINGTGIVGSNVRFGHTTNARVIGTKVQDNKGAHHFEAGGVKNLLVSDCEFTGYKHGDTSDSEKEFSIEAVQLDVTHRAKLNFSDYGVYDDLAVEDATIVNNNFHDVFRGVGSHHAVLGSYYKNITIKDNNFTNLRDRAINASYFKKGTITNNTMTNVISGIMASSMVYQQYYQPNRNSGIAPKTGVETLNADLKITNNIITINGNQEMEEHFTANPIKYGIKVAGDNVTGTQATATKNEDSKNNPNASGKAAPAGNYYITGVTVTGNNISVHNAPTNDSQRIKCGLLLWYAKNCSNIASNTINLGGYNVKDSTGAGIKVNFSPGNTINKNTVKGVTEGTNALGIQVSDNSTNTKITNNTITKVAKDAISFTKIKSGTNNITGNTITDPKKNGITAYQSNITNINSNKITNAADTGIMVDTGTATNIKSNTVTNTKKNQGIKVIGTATTISSNTVNKAGQHGIFVTKGKQSTLFEKNVIKSAKKHGIFTDNGVKYAIGNKLTGCASKNVVGLSKGVAAKTKAVTVKKGKTVKIGTFPASGATWKTSNKKIATVSKKGVVKGVKKGTATITITKNKLKTTVKVTVK